MPLRTAKRNKQMSSRLSLALTPRQCRLSAVDGYRTLHRPGPGCLLVCIGDGKTRSEDDAAQSSLLELNRCFEYRRWTSDKAANAPSGRLSPEREKGDAAESRNPAQKRDDQKFEQTGDCSARSTFWRLGFRLPDQSQEALQSCAPAAADSARLSFEHIDQQLQLGRT